MRKENSRIQILDFSSADSVYMILTYGMPRVEDLKDRITHENLLVAKESILQMQKRSILKLKKISSLAYIESVAVMVFQCKKQYGGAGKRDRPRRRTLEVLSAQGNVSGFLCQQRQSLALVET